MREPLLKVIPPALLGRLVAIPFEYGENVVKPVISRCTESESGGRMIHVILTNTMLPDISREFLTRVMAGKAIG